MRDVGRWEIRWGMRDVEWSDKVMLRNNNGWTIRDTVSGTQKGCMVPMWSDRGVEVSSFDGMHIIRSILQQRPFTVSTPLGHRHSIVIVKLQNPHQLVIINSTITFSTLSDIYFIRSWYWRRSMALKETLDSTQIYVGWYARWILHTGGKKRQKALNEKSCWTRGDVKCKKGREMQKTYGKNEESVLVFQDAMELYHLGSNTWATSALTLILPKKTVRKPHIQSLNNKL